MTTLFLPFPPSVNGMFNGKVRRFKSDGYKLWLLDAKRELDIAKYKAGFSWKNHIGKVEVHMLLRAPDNRVQDVDNRIKAVLDFLVTHQVIQGDDSRYVRGISAYWADDVGAAGCAVEIVDVVPVTKCKPAYAIGYKPDVTVRPKRRGNKHD